VVSPFCKFHIIHVADRNEYISATLEYSLNLMQNMFNNTVMWQLSTSMKGLANIPSFK
jgi:hypothetical protein